MFWQLEDPLTLLLLQSLLHYLIFELYIYIAQQNATLEAFVQSDFELRTQAQVKGKTGCAAYTVIVASCTWVVCLVLVI